MMLMCAYNQNMLGAIKSGDDSGKIINELPEDVNAFSNNLKDEILPIHDTMKMTNNNSFKPYVDGGRSLSEITIPCC